MLIPTVAVADTVTETVGWVADAVMVEVLI